MKRTRPALVAGITTLGVAAGAFVPAHADDTTVTFTLTSGSIAISAPSTTQDLGTTGITPGNTTSAAFDDAVSVTDNRGDLVAAWTVQVTATDFTGDVTGETISKAQANYSSGAVTSSAGLVVTPTIGATMAIASTLVGAGTGSNTASWTPTVGITVPVGAVADDYTGTVTHSLL